MGKASAKSRIDHVARFVVWELLRAETVAYYQLAGQLHRIAHHHRAGLTEGEYKFLVARHDALHEEAEKMKRLNQRLKGSIKWPRQ